MTTFFDDGYQLPQMPGHRVNPRAIAADVVWKQASALVDFEQGDQPQNVKDWAKGMRERLENLAKELEAGSGLFVGDAPLCPCGRGRVVWHNLCPDCLAEEDQAERDTAKSVRETR